MPIEWYRSHNMSGLFSRPFLVVGMGVVTRQVVRINALDEVVHHAEAADSKVRNSTQIYCLHVPKALDI
eukprot:870377-Amphidinium_carterae.1